jgi:hypothetical protein
LIFIVLPIFGLVVAAVGFTIALDLLHDAASALGK